jgi:tryptophan synthase alpha chain
MSRIDDAFARLRREDRGGLITYVTAGDPDCEASEDILVELAAAGADVLEVGVPFSDPLADGPVIQRAAERALAAGMTLRGALDLVSRVRRRTETPIVLFTYANPVVRMDPRTFAATARAAGVDGVLVLDYPIEEAGPLREALVEAGIDPIFLLSPTTSDERIRRANDLGRGFLYVISRLGVTGARSDLASDVGSLLRRVRANSTLPVALGFGISQPDQVAEAGRMADAAVVGSALVTVIAEHGGEPDVAARAGQYVRWLLGQSPTAGR